LLYHANEVVLPSGASVYFPVCLKGAAFFQEFLDRPGGLSQYLGARYAQYYFYPNLGPLILTAVAWLVYLAADRLIRLAGGTYSRGLRFVAPLLLLITYNRYTFHLENYAALLAALIPAIIYITVANRVNTARARIFLFALFSVAVYYVAGGLYLLFAFLCAASEFSAGRRCAAGSRYVLVALYLAAAAGVPLLGKHLFDVSWAAAYAHPAGILAPEAAAPGLYPSERPSSADSSAEEPWSADYPLSGSSMKMTTLWGLYLFFVFVPASLPFWRKLARGVSSARVSLSAFRPRGEKKTAWKQALGKYWLGRRVAPVYAVSALGIAGVLVAFGTLDEDARTVLRANYFARMEMWPEFLDEVDRYPAREFPASVMVDVNRALFETGQMGTRLFSYPQRPDVLFRLGKDAARLKGGCEVLLKLGRVNEAEHAALEALEMGGERPDILRLLADVYVVKRQPEVARVFLNVLRKDLVHGSWAEERLCRLDADPLLSSDPRIRDARSFMPLADMVTESGELMLLALLARNRENRMAAEYLMAHYLLTCQLEKAICHLGSEDFGPQAAGDPAIPEHYAEAVLLYLHSINRPLVAPPELPGRTIDQQTIEKVRRVIDLSGEYSNDEAALAAVLAAEFPNSGCRYFLTGKAGGPR